MSDLTDFERARARWQNKRLLEKRSKARQVKEPSEEKSPGGEGPVSIIEEPDQDRLDGPAPGIPKNLGQRYNDEERQRKQEERELMRVDY